LRECEEMPIDLFIVARQRLIKLLLWKLSHVVLGNWRLN